MRELSLSVLDLVQNSLRYGATLVEICVTDNEQDGLLSISIKDNGCGIDEKVLEKVADPFYTTCKTHKVGLGLSLFRQRAVLTGGSFDIKSVQGSGTTVCGCFCKTNINFVPLGDISSVLQALVMSDTGAEFVFSFSSNCGGFSFNTAQLFSSDEAKDYTTFYKATVIKEIFAKNSFQ